MIDSLSIAGIASGVIVAGAALADWGVSEPTKDRIRLSLEQRLYRFRYTTLRTFGRNEIDFSVKAIARLFGPRLFSWRRVGIVVGCYIAVLIALVAQSGQWHLLINYLLLPQALMGAAFFALGISLTIAAARWVSHAPGGRTVLATVALALFHVALFLYWRPVLALADALVMDWILAAARYYYLHFQGISIPGSSQSPLSWHLAIFELEPTRAVKKTIIEYRLLLSGRLGFTMALVGNCLALLLFVLRMGLLAYFLGAVAYVQWIRPVLIWFWTGLLRSRAVFTPPASAIATLVYVGPHSAEFAKTVVTTFGS